MASLNSEFQKLPKIVQLLLLIIPFVGWVTEVVVRLSAFLHGKATNQLIILILSIPFGLILGIVDFVWVLLKGKLILT